MPSLSSAPSYRFYREGPPKVFRESNLPGHIGFVARDSSPTNQARSTFTSNLPGPDFEGTRFIEHDEGATMSLPRNPRSKKGEEPAAGWSAPPSSAPLPSFHSRNVSISHSPLRQSPLRQVTSTNESSVVPGPGATVSRRFPSLWRDPQVAQDFRLALTDSIRGLLRRHFSYTRGANDPFSPFSSQEIPRIYDNIRDRFLTLHSPDQPEFEDRDEALRMIRATVLQEVRYGLRPIVPTSAGSRGSPLHQLAVSSPRSVASLVAEGSVATPWLGDQGDEFMAALAYYLWPIHSIHFESGRTAADPLSPDLTASVQRIWDVVYAATEARYGGNTQDGSSTPVFQSIRLSH